MIERGSFVMLARAQFFREALTIMARAMQSIKPAIELIMCEIEAVLSQTEAAALFGGDGYCH